MEEYQTKVRVPGEAGSVAALAAIRDGRLIVRAGELEIGEWELDSIVLDFRDDEWHLRADGEELLLAVTPAADFAEGVRKARASEPVARPEVGLLRRALSYLFDFFASRTRRSKLALLGAATWLVTFILLPALAIGALIAAGSLLLVTGLFATLDPFIGVRVKVAPIVLIAAGGSLLAVVLLAAIIT